MPDALELPGMLRTVIPLVRRQRLAGLLGCVVDEHVARARRRCTGCGRLVCSRARLVPRLAAVVGALNDLPETAGAVRRIEPIRISGRPLEVVNLPAGKVGAADVPFFPLAVRRKNKCALPCANQYAYFAHVSRSFLKFAPLWINFLCTASHTILPSWPRLAPHRHERAQPLVAQVNPSP